MITLRLRLDAKAQTCFPLNPEVRASQLGTQGPFEYDLLHTIETENAWQLEQELHMFFAEKRAQGEWFVLDEDDIQLFINWDA